MIRRELIKAAPRPLTDADAARMLHALRVIRDMLQGQGLRDAALQVARETLARVGE